MKRWFYIFCIACLWGSGMTLRAQSLRDNPLHTIQSLQHRLSALTGKLHQSPVVIDLPQGYIHFPDSLASSREYYISNHDQVNPRKIGLVLEDLHNVIIDGHGAELVCHGRMIPLALVNCTNVTLRNFSIDNADPVLRQLKVIEVSPDKSSMLVEVELSGKYKVEDNRFIAIGSDYEYRPEVCMGFRADKRLTYRRADMVFNPRKVKDLGNSKLKIEGWKEIALCSKGERLVLRNYDRPAPGIFIDHCSDITLNHVQVHYAEGMGLVAQMTENIMLDGFSVSLRGKSDPRYFTTQADATHFSGCKGLITSRQGLYEGMADDAINVHGTYLKVIRRVDNRTLILRYLHPQTWGFAWGYAGDRVQFVRSDLMQRVGSDTYKISRISPADTDSVQGAKEFCVIFDRDLPQEISSHNGYGAENLSYTPEVIFSNNLIRNNRARGALFSTPRSVVCERNTFDHTHGTAILLCGDCNGWYETGACRDVLIRNNKFVNALTANYQFTNAVISISPEIPDLKSQTLYFHSNIRIEDNEFDTFDRPLLYAKSVNGLRFTGNVIRYNKEFEPFHHNTYLFNFEKVKCVVIKDNAFFHAWQKPNDLKVTLSPPEAVKIIP
ncbi:right-handed parallel beta-helix repeat-containing protein [Porphyromonas pogonae]|uniref:right-handed parallel beta-helix repeat-containing protein n=1 Tax=Porphyromonas pogonae TaxID=867595 RepID=UPI002E75E1FB|nr:right-handed parallel beta-helix repeat-containing protein [Porphyromonas pogonae]